MTHAAEATPIPSGFRRYLTAHTALTTAGLALLVLWSCWWVSNFRHDRMIEAERTWVPGYRYLSLDFYASYYAANHWLAGGNPYREAFGDPDERPYVYPPAILWFFAWCPQFSADHARLVWFAVQLLTTFLAVWTCWKARRTLELWNIPLPLAFALILFSTPMLYALERGQCDHLVLLLLVGAVWLLRGRSWLNDLAAGALLGLATCIKIYPGLLLLGLVSAGRWRAAVALGATFAAVTGLNLPMTLDALAKLQGLAQENHLQREAAPFLHAVHTLGGSWKALWADTPLRFLGHIPGTAGAGGLLLTLCLWVSYRVFKASERSRLLCPYLLWLVAVATFVPTAANDYNLIFLPLAVLATWDRRDPVLVHVLLALLVLWWQPLAFMISPRIFFVFKLGGVLAVGVSIVTRAREQQQVAQSILDINLPLAA